MSLPTIIDQITELAKEVAILFYEQDGVVFEMENDIDQFIEGSWFGIVQRLHLENVARTNLEILQQHYYEVLYAHTREIAKLDQAKKEEN